MNEQEMLLPIDAVDVTILVDNAVDLLLAGNEMVKRVPLTYATFESEPLIAEHGYALLLTVHHEGRHESILYDAGLGRGTLLHNMDVLGVRAQELRAVVLSHGHADHHGGLEGLFRRIARRKMPLVLHPDVWRDRRIVFPTGVVVHLPPPSQNDLEREGVQIIEERSPTLLLDGMVLVTGQIERVTDFEKGLPTHQARHDHGWEPDTWIWDDQALVCHVRNKGLVVLSSCSHAGVINVLRQAQRVTGMEKIAAFVGGLHLSGAIFEPIILPTISELKRLAPEVVVPGHCTGWKATHALARIFPDAYVQASVGTQLHFSSEP